MPSSCPGCGGPLLGDSVASPLRSACPACMAQLLLADPLPPSDRFPADSAMGPYRLVHEIARGGMGAVWLATRTADGSPVALKLLPHSLGSDPSRLARFRAEATLAARLVHPHIVAIRDIGEHDGIPYFTMDLVDGPDLGEVAGRRPMAPREAARIVRTVALAVQFAHEQGVLHRDIKPTNVLLGTDGEPRVTDFGLARLLEIDARLTATGETMGSPSFMAPEQVAGQSQPSGVRTDVHGLGGLLYFCLTGRAPFAAESVAAALAKVVQSHPVPPSDWVPGIPESLEAITMCCLAREPSARYPSAAALADDLERALTGQSARALTAKNSRDAQPWWRGKTPWILALLLAPAFVALASLAGWAVHQQRRAEAGSRHDMLHATALARYAMDLSQAGAAADAGDGAAALRLLESSLPSGAMPDLRSIEWFVLRRRVATLDGIVHPHPGPRPAEAAAWNGWPADLAPRRILFSADASRIAVGFGPQPRSVAMAWRVAEPSAPPATLPGFPLALDRTGNAVFVATRDGRLESGPWIHPGGSNAGSPRIAPSASQWEASPDGAFVAWLDDAHAVQLLHLATGQTLPGPIGRFDSFRLSPDGNAILLAGPSGPSLFTLRPRQQSVVATGAVASVAFTRSGLLGAVGFTDGSVAAIDVEGRRPIMRWLASPHPVLGLAFAPDEQTLVTGDASGDLRFWNTTLWRELLKVHFPPPISLVAIAPTGQQLALVSNGRLHLLDATGTAAPAPTPSNLPTPPRFRPAAFDGKTATPEGRNEPTEAHVP